MSVINYQKTINQGIKSSKKALFCVIQSPRRVIPNPRRVIQSPRRVIQNPRRVIQNPRRVIQNPRRVIQHLENIESNIALSAPSQPNN